MSSLIILSAKGGSKVGTIPGVEEITIELGKLLKRAKGPGLIGSWTWQKMTLALYGYKEGRKGTESTQELPSPYDDEKLFGDACVVAMANKKLVPLTAEMWKRFYNSKAGAYNNDDEAGEGEDLEDEEDEEDLEEEEEMEEEYDEEEMGEEDQDVGDDVEEGDEEEDEPVRATVVRAKGAAMFKKIPKWMYSADLKAEPYVM